MTSTYKLQFTRIRVIGQFHKVSKKYRKIEEIKNNVKKELEKIKNIKVDIGDKKPMHVYLNYMQNYMQIAA